MDKSTARKYLEALLRCPVKYVTSETLSKELGIYPDAISAALSYFDPILKLDMSYDLRELIPALENYVNAVPRSKAAKPASKKRKRRKTARRRKAPDLPYGSIVDFVYDKMSVEGFLNKGAALSRDDLKLLRKLVSLEEHRLVKPGKVKRK